MAFSLKNELLLSLLLPAFAACTALRPGPPTRLTGKWHAVERSDTVVAVAKQYGSDAETLRELNDLQSDRALSEREVIFVPLAQGKSPSEAARPAARVSRPTPAPTPEPARAPSAKPPATPPKKQVKSCETAGNPCLAWPLSGTLGKGFAATLSAPHDGQDIRVPQGTPIRAAADGDVLYSGAKIKGYGNLVILRHDGGILTVYAHNDHNTVSEGARVKQGDILGKAGQSGNAAAVHLHFEVRVNEVPVDPLEYLPPR